MLGNFLMLLLSSADFFKIYFFKKFFQDHCQSVNWCGSRSGSKLFANLIQGSNRLETYLNLEGVRINCIVNMLFHFWYHFFCESHILVLVYVREVIKSC